MYEVTIPIYHHNVMHEVGEVVSGETFGVFLIDLLRLAALKPITEKEPA